MHTQYKRLSAAVVLFLVAAMLFAGVLVSAPRAAATHDTVMWSRPFWAATTGDDEFYSSVLADGNGTFYVFYLRTDSFSGLTDVYESKWTTRGPSGVPEGILYDVLVNVNNVGEVATSDPFFGLPATPTAAIDHSGNLFVVWTSDAYDVYVSKSTDGGETWLPAVKANSATVTTAYDFAPSITITGTGTSEKIWVSWSQLWFTGFVFYNNATVSHSDNFGSTFIGYTNASGQPGASTLILGTAIAADSQGRLYLTYTAIDFSVFTVYANYTWSDTGATWAAPTTLNSSGGGLFPVVAVDAADRVHLAWFDYSETPSGSLTIDYIRSADRGATWTTPMPVNQGASGVGFGTPSLVVHGETVMVAWNGQQAFTGIGYAISADGGDLWYPEGFYAPGFSIQATALAADENGTYYATWTYNNGFDDDVGIVFWDGPPSAPVITNIARGTGSLTVTWSASPEPDVVLYRVWRSADGVSYDLVATVSAGTTSYADSGLVNGTYWYSVTAVDLRGTSSHDSVPMAATVGPTLQERIDQLETEIASLQTEIASLQTALATAQADIDDLQTRLTTLQNTVNALQQTIDTNNAATTTQLNNLKTQLDNLQNQLNAVRTEQATQTMSYVNLGFEVIVVVLLALILIMQMRKPKLPTSYPAPPKPEGEL